MKTLALAVTGILMVALTASPLAAQTTDRKPGESPSASPATGEPARAARPSTEQTGGDARPNAVDPAEAHKTGGNAGEGASYSRSQEKGHSTTDSEQKKK